MPERRVIATDQAPKAIGPYSQAIVSGTHIFTAGQIPLDPTTGKIINGDFSDRVNRVLDNIEAILEAAGTSLHKSIKLTVFMTDLGNFSKVNAVFEKRFSGVAPPARSAVQVAALPLGTDIEIECIAGV